MTRSTRPRALAAGLATALVAATVGLLVAPLGTGAAMAADDRSVVLAIDASGSMAGSRMVAARGAAAAFVAALPRDVAVGIVAFADEADVRLLPTMDRVAVADAIDGIVADGDTALRDGIVAALPLASRIVVLSDGEDTASSTTAPRLAQAVQRAGTAIDIVALAPTREHAGLLRDIAAASGGTYASSAQAGDLAAAFAVIAQAMSATPVAPPTVPPPPASALRAPTSGAVAETAAAAWPPGVLALLASAAVALLALGLLGIDRARARRAGVRRALDAYATPGAGAPVGVLPAVERAPRIAALERRVRDQRWHGRLAEGLDLAGIRMAPLAWLAACTMAVIGLGLVAGLLAQAVALGVIASGAAALGIAQWVRWRASSAVRSFDAELPDLLLLLASGMRSGLSFAQALEATAVEAAGEVGRQMRRAVGETRVGTPVEEALMRAAMRVGSDDLRWTVQALAMQRQVGGNLSSILETAAASVRGRADLRREIRTLSAEGRLSAAILIGLPVALFAFLVLTRRDYVDFFWTQALGMVTLGAFLVIGLVGALWIRAIVRIEA